MWRVPKEKGELILCKECPNLGKRRSLRESLEFRKALSIECLI
jgi:hypothetical protein